MLRSPTVNFESLPFDSVICNKNIRKLHPGKTFNAGKTQLILFDWSNSTGAIDVKMDESVLEGKSSFKVLGCLSLLNWLGVLTLSLLLQLPPRKFEP